MSADRRSPKAELPSVVDRYDPARVRGATLGALVAQAVAETLKDCRRERTEIAAEMSDYLGERVTEAMLNQYASQANDKHNIPAHRLTALAVVTGDNRPLNALCEEAGLVAIGGRYVALIRREMAKEERARLDQVIEDADREWKGDK